MVASSNCAQFHVGVHIPYPISDHNGQTLYHISDQNGSKTIPFAAAHTYMAYIKEFPRVSYKVVTSELNFPAVPGDVRTPDPCLSIKGLKNYEVPLSG